MSKLKNKESDPDYLWKKERGRTFYIKTSMEDIKDLKKNIVEYGINRNTHRVKFVLYKELFRRIRELKLDIDVENYMVALLEPIHFGEMNNEEYLLRACYVRFCIEHIFRSMYEYGLLPRSYVNNKRRNIVNLHQSFSHLKKYFIPPVQIEIVSGFGNLISKYLHTDPDKKEHIESYSKYVGSIYLLRCVTIWLSDFIMWYYSYVKTNDDIQKNIRKWRGKIENPDGYKGLLYWNPDESIWEIEFQGERICLDNREPDYNKANAYRDEQECYFFLSIFQNLINILYDVTPQVYKT